METVILEIKIVAPEIDKYILTDLIREYLKKLYPDFEEITICELDKSIMD